MLRTEQNEDPKIFIFNDLLTAFLRITVVADKDLLAWSPEEWRPVDGVVEAQTTIVKNVDISGADLVQWLELQRRDPTLF